MTHADIFLPQLFRACGPWFLGLCCGNVWIGWMNGEKGLAPTSLWDALCALTMIATLLIAIAYGLRRGVNVKRSYQADWPIAVAMALFTLPATGLISDEPYALRIVSTVATEVGMAWLYIRWGVFLSVLDIRSAIGCILAAHVAGCSAKLVLYYIPVWVAVVFVSLLPIAAMALLGKISVGISDRVDERTVGQGTGRADQGTAEGLWCTGLRGAAGPLWKVAAFVACYRFFFYAVSIKSTATEESLSLSTVCCLAEIAVSLVLIYMLLVKSGTFTFQQVWSVFLLLMGFIILCALLPEAGSVGNHIRSAAGSLLVMFTWLVFADVARHSTLHPFVLFGIARIAYELPRLLVRGLEFVEVVTVPSNSASFTGVLLFVLLVFAVLFFDWRDPTLALIFSDFQQRDAAGAPDRLREVCRQAASAGGLTHREEEVLFYLCQGRTRAYIAETLYLSENTVRGHTQRIYSKLGVHNKTELQRKLGV